MGTDSNPPQSQPNGIYERVKVYTFAAKQSKGVCSWFHLCEPFLRHNLATSKCGIVPFAKKHICRIVPFGKHSKEMGLSWHNEHITTCTYSTYTQTGICVTKL